MVIFSLGWYVLGGLLFEYPSVFQVVFWNHLFHGLLFLLQILCYCKGGRLGGSFHVKADFLWIDALSCAGGNRARREELPLLIHGELAGEVAMGEINSRVSPIDIGVVMLQPVMP